MTTQDNATPGAPKSLTTPLVISISLVAPFMVLQWVNRRVFQEDFPVVLFAFMSLHAALIALALTPALRCLRLEKRISALKLGHWAGLLVGALLVAVYADVVRDQLPCFLGQPNCD